MIKLAIIGYGQMGNLIEKLATEYDFEIVSIIDPLLDNEISKESLAGAEVCIEFTTPDVAFTNIQKICDLGKNMVVGTTGWLDKLDAVRKLVQKNEIGMVYGSNFSFGMNLFFQMFNSATKLMNKIEDYEVFGLELHHNIKKDSPSGTAKILSDIVLKNTDGKTSAQFEKLDRKIKKNEFHFGSVRAGNIPGTHLIGFDSAADTIELKHTARNREGLAIGALKAAEWITKKKGLYDFTAHFSEIIGI